MFMENVVRFHPKKGGGNSSFKGNGNSCSKLIKPFMQSFDTSQNGTINQSRNGFNKLIIGKYVCQVCEKVGHNARSYFLLKDLLLGNGTSMVLIINYSHGDTFHKDGAHASWILNIGVSHHVIADDDQITKFVPYSRSEGVALGNSVKIPFANDGCTFLIVANNYILVLKYILHAPIAISNLLFVNKLYKENDVSIKFDSSLFSIKNKITKKIKL